MKKKLRITNSTFVMTAVLGSLLIMSVVLASTLRATRQTISATDEAVSAVSSFYLEAMADRRAKTITNLINNDFQQMEKAVDFIDEEKIETREELRNVLGRIKSLLSLNRFALVDEDDVVYTQYTTYTGKSRHEFLAEEKMSERVISMVSAYGSSKELVLAIPINGISVAGKPMKACFVQIDIRDIVELLALDDTDKTLFGIYSKNGANISETEMGPIISDGNLLEAVKGVASEEEWQELCDHFENGEEGNLTFAAGANEETMYYVPIENTDLEMAVLIRESLIQDQIRDISGKTLTISRNQIVFTLVSVLLLAVILLLEYGQISKEKLEAEKETSRAFHNMANTDALTGVRNKHAYTEYETVLNERIKDHTARKLAVALCDINGLKYVNDTEGHAAGDKLIKDACALICRTFAHGAVFRTGGDEFVVIIQGDACYTLSQTIDEFNRTAEENIEKNSVVVALGCSYLGPEDRVIRDVFERADQLMYERKKELKEIGAKTRL